MPATKVRHSKLSPAAIKRGRLKMGLSRSELARRLGVCAAAVGHWERGIRVPRGSAQVLLLQTLATA